MSTVWGVTSGGHFMSLGVTAARSPGRPHSGMEAHWLLTDEVGACWPRIDQWVVCMAVWWVWGCSDVSPTEITRPDCLRVSRVWSHWTLPHGVSLLVSGTVLSQLQPARPHSLVEARGTVPLARLTAHASTSSHLALCGSAEGQALGGGHHSGIDYWGSDEMW